MKPLPLTPRGRGPYPKEGLVSLTQNHETVRLSTKMAYWVYLWLLHGPLAAALAPNDDEAALRQQLAFLIIIIIYVVVAQHYLARASQCRGHRQPARGALAVCPQT